MRNSFGARVDCEQGSLNVLGKLRFFFNFARHGWRTRLLRKIGVIDFEFDFLEDHNLHNFQAELIEEYPNFQEATPIMNRSNWSSKYGRPQRMFRFPQATICPLSGRVYSKDGTFIANSSPWSPVRAIQKWPAPPNKLVQAPQLGSTATFIPARSFYHFLLEDFPSLLRISSKFPELEIFVGPQSRPHVRMYLGLAHFRFSALGGYTRFADYVFEETPPAMQPTRLDVETLRGWALDAIPSSKDARNSRIYVSRRIAGRFPKNEDAVQNLFTNAGFQVLHLETMKIEEQIKAFRNAEIIAGTHGAGLANLVWASSGTHVLEIRLRNQPDCFTQISKIVGLSHLKIENPGPDWFVDLDLLAERIAACTIQSLTSNQPRS